MVETPLKKATDGGDYLRFSQVEFEIVCDRLAERAIAVNDTRWTEKYQVLETQLEGIRDGMKLQGSLIKDLQRKLGEAEDLLALATAENSKSDNCGQDHPDETSSSGEDIEQEFRGGSDALVDTDIWQVGALESVDPLGTADRAHCLI